MITSASENEGSRNQKIEKKRSGGTKLIIRPKVKWKEKEKRIKQMAISAKFHITGTEISGQCWHQKITIIKRIWRAETITNHLFKWFFIVQNSYDGSFFKQTLATSSNIRNLSTCPNFWFLFSSLPCIPLFLFLLSLFPHKSNKISNSKESICTVFTDCWNP